MLKKAIHYAQFSALFISVLLASIGTAVFYYRQLISQKICSFLSCKVLLLRINKLKGKWILFFLLVVSLFFITVIPPLNSPDENAHIQRAYLLTQGKIILETRLGKSSGGMVDSGLVNYVQHNIHQISIHQKQSDLIKGVYWSGTKQFSQDMVGTGYYFPFVYMPQALGLKIGELSNLSIHQSYFLARYMSILAIAGVLLLAFNLYPINPLAIALLIAPMSLFQFASTSIDGISTALAVLAISLFLRISHLKKYSILYYVFLITVFLLASSRLHTLPLFILVFSLWFQVKEKKYLFFALFTLFLVSIWTLIAIKNTVDLRVLLTLSPTNILFFYIKNPLSLIVLINETVLVNYIGFIRGLIGILGWLDAPFSDNQYKVYSIFLSVIALFSISIKNLKVDWLPRAVLLVTALMSIALVFVLLLVTWTPHPATIIHGIQGRYFIIPAIMLAYAIAGDATRLTKFQSTLAYSFVCMMGCFTIVSMTNLLIERYYLATI
ncbi:MAG: DUF2142 domain-containing protein [Neisseriaceae bacterium]|nr:DUF2142 domain-containing protein [Neisseriaceae bacterium]